MPAPLSLGGYGTTGSNVTLRFTNLKTKATVDLTVTGNGGQHAPADPAMDLRVSGGFVMGAQ